MQWINNSQGTNSTLNVESWGSKEDVKVTYGIKGLPKAPKGYGNREIIVPIRGRISVAGVRKFYTIADGVSTVSTDGLKKIQKINELCINNKDFIITDKLYRLLYDKELYYAAYKKLKSKAGFMRQGITPSSLDGMSALVIEEIIAKVKDGSFIFKPAYQVHIPKSS